MLEKSLGVNWDEQEKPEGSRRRMRMTQGLRSSMAVRKQKDMVPLQRCYLKREVGWGRIEKRHEEEFELDFLPFNERNW